MSIHLMHRAANRDLIAYWRSGGLPAIPAGIILPTSLASAPSGWNQLLTGISRNWIVPKALGSAPQTIDTENAAVFPNATIDTQGGHTGTSNYFGAGGGAYAGNVADAGHDHSGVATTGTRALPERYQTIFLECAADTDDLPANVFWPAYDALSRSAWTRHVSPAGGDALLVGVKPGAGTVQWVDGVTNNYLDYTVTTDGVHTHGGMSGSGNNDSRNPYKANIPPQPLHNHGGTVRMTITFNIAKMLFNWWYHSSMAQSLRNEGGVYAFWRTTAAPPTGWVRLDGSNGEIDPAYYHAGIAYNQSSGGTKAATSAANMSGTVVTPTDGAHKHNNQGDLSNDDREMAYHDDLIGDHTHTLTLSYGAFKPELIYWHIIRRLW